MKKAVGACLCSLLLVMGGCGKEETTTKKEVFNYTYENGEERSDVILFKTPERAVTLSHFMTEMLLALGLEEKMVGTALLDNEVLPQFKEAYASVPVLEIGEGHAVSKESFLALKPDFVSGWDVSLTPQTTGTGTELIEKGIAPLVVSALAPDATIEHVYEDFKTLGKIFDVEEKADEVISEMKKEIEEISIVKGEKPKVLVYDSGTKDAFIMGAGLANNLVTLAGGVNIFSDLEQSYATVSFENIVERNPDIIVVVDYFAGGNLEDKINFLKNHPGMKNVTAIKENRIGVIGLADLSPGIRNSQAVKTLNELFTK